MSCPACGTYPEPDDDVPNLTQLIEKWRKEVSTNT